MSTETLTKSTEWLSESETSREFNVPVRTLRNHRYYGIGFPYTRLGRRIIYQRSKVIAYLEGNTIESNETEAAK